MSPVCHESESTLSEGAAEYRGCYRRSIATQMLSPEQNAAVAEEGSTCKKSRLGLQRPKMYEFCSESG
jgi:hypothetical protein